MPFIRKKAPLIISETERQRLEKIKSSRKESFDRVLKATILLSYSDKKSTNSIARELSISRPRVDRCIDKALSGGIDFALRDLKRPGRPALITADDKAWVVNLACTKPKEHGYSYEVWTYKLLAQHVKNNAVQTKHPSLSNASKSIIHNILNEQPIKPHKITYYLERRDPQFEEKMAQILIVYKEVQIANETNDSENNWRVISYDEKPGIQAIENIAPELLPVPGKYPTIARDYEYKRHGTISLLAGIDLHDGKVTAIVKDRHRSREFIEFLKKLDNNYDPNLKLRIILDNHSSHISKETMAWLKNYPNRFEFIFTPKHGSWLNMIEMFFSKMSRSFLRHLSVNSKEELLQRIIMYFDEINNDPVIFRWKYKMDEILL